MLTRWIFALLVFAVFSATLPADAQPTQVECGTNCGISAELIAAYPAPAVTRLAANETLLNDRRYQRVIDGVNIHDAPNGNIISNLDAGFNFVTTQGEQDNWTQINNGQWVLTEHLRHTNPSRFSGVLLPAEPLPYSVAWVLVNTVPSRTPGAEPTAGDLAVLRYTLINIYESIEVEGWRWYQIGVDQWIDQRMVAKVLPIERPAEVDTERWVSVDLYEQVLIAYENETPVFATLISSGLPDWTTNEGVFNVYIRYPRTIMSGARERPEFYYLEEVPWTMYFDGDIGLHGTYWHDGFGYRHSRGCVNMSITDASWVYNWAAVEFEPAEPANPGLSVHVYSSGEYR